jgi:uncharacterized protein (DUF1778 family)
MDPGCPDHGGSYTPATENMMKKAKDHTMKVTVRLTDEEYDVLRRLCALKKTSQTRYLTRLATHHAKHELLQYAVGTYLEGKASLSELAAQTGFDVPTIMETVAQTTEKDTRAVEGFLAAVQTLAHVHNDPEFYHLAVQAVTGAP